MMNGTHQADGYHGVLSRAGVLASASRGRWRRLARSRSLLLTLAALFVRPAWADGPTTNFHLPAEPFTQAVLDFSHQSGLSTIYALTPQMQTLRTRQVSGRMASSEALARMLAGTGLTFEFDSAHSVIIEPAAAPSARESAAAAAPAPQTSPVPPPPVPAQSEGRLEQVDVTGSLIPGVQDVIAPLVYVKQQQLAQADFATVEDALYSLPIVSLNAPREDLGVDDNYQYGAGIDLRGLGVGATLVLVNGYRQPFSGLNGDFVDVSTIPSSAVERIEVLPDGASALYGSDAIAGVVNIIMRDDFQGAETQARYGTAVDGRRALMVSQLFGTHWDSGHAMLAYQFSDETPLAAAERPYAANADKTPYGGADYDSYYSNPGNILNPETLQPAYGIPAGQNGRELTTAELSSAINLQNQFAQLQLFPEVTAHEFYGSASEDLNDRAELFAEGRFAERDTVVSTVPDEQVLTVPASNPFYVNPFAGVPYTLVAYSFSSDLGPTTFSARTRVYMGTLGVRLRIAGSWQATVSESYGHQLLHSDEYGVPNEGALTAALADSNPATAFDPFGDGSNTSAQTLAAISGDYPLYANSGIESTRAVADGSLFRMPAGEAKLAVGVERREESLSHDIVDALSTTDQTFLQSYGRHVVSIFSQLALPLLGDPDNTHEAPRLDMNVAGRYERYSDFGGAFSPTARLEFIPFEAVKLRASWGRSFRAPTLDDLYDTSQNLAGSVLLTDPQSPTGRSLVLVEQGSNPDLKQETATTWTVGADFAPSFLPGSSLSLTYYDIDYENRIAQPAEDDPLNILVDESEWAPFITRNPTRAQIAAVCNSPVYEGSVSACLASSPAAIVDVRLANLASTWTSGLDIEAHQKLHGALGSFDFGVTANYVFEFDQRASASSTAIDILNTVGNPLSLRLRGTADWSLHGPLLPGPEVDLAVNYTGGYQNPGSTLLPSVSPWTTVDIRVVYRTQRGAGWLSGTELSVSAVNVFNHDPPFVDSEFGYDQYNVQPLGRVVSADFTKRW